MTTKEIIKLCYSTLKEAENALTDYIKTIENQGATLNYGHKVLRHIKATILVIDLLEVKND